MRSPRKRASKCQNAVRMQGRDECKRILEESFQKTHLLKMTKRKSLCLLRVERTITAEPLRKQREEVDLWVQMCCHVNRMQTIGLSGEIMLEKTDLSRDLA